MNHVIAVLLIPTALALCSVPARAQPADAPDRTPPRGDVDAPAASSAPMAAPMDAPTATQPQPRTWNGSAAVGAALGATLGLAVGVGVDAAVFAAILGSDQALEAVLAAGGGIAPLLFLVAAAGASAGAGVGAWLGGADRVGIPAAAGGAVIVLPVGVVAGSMLGGLTGWSIAVASGADDPYGGFALGALSGIGIGALVSAAGGAAAGALVEERDLDVVFGEGRAAPRHGASPGGRADGP